MGKCPVCGKYHHIGDVCKPTYKQIMAWADGWRKYKKVEAKT